MEGCYEQLKNRIEELKNSSRDPFFTEYLQKLNNRLIQEKYQMDLIGAELERSYQMYLKRNPQKEEVVSEREAVATATIEGAGEVVMQPYMAEPIPAPVPQTVPLPSSYTQMPTTTAPAKKKDKEFVIGIGVFSVIGVFFVLSAFVMLGMYFMNSFVKGMILYAIALVVWLISELLVRRKSQTLANILSSIGIAGLYIATMVNFIALKNFNELVTGIVLGGITLLVFIVNRKKTLGMIQMAAVAISTLVFAVHSSDIVNMDVSTYNIFITVYLVVAILFLELIFYRLAEKEKNNYLLTTVYFISMSICVLSGVICLLEKDASFLWMKIAIMASTAAMGLLFGWLLREKQVSWTQGYLVIGVAMLLHVVNGEGWEQIITVLACMFLAKLLSGCKPLRLADAVVTSLAAIGCCGMGAKPESYVVLAGLVLSVLLIHYWQLFYELVITNTVVLFVLLNMENALALSIVVAVLWLAVVLFNQVERFRGKTIQAFNSIILVEVLICYLSLPMQDYDELKIVYFILTVLGLGIIAFAFQEKNELMSKFRGIVIAGFLTYMVLVSDFSYEIVASILLMLVGVGSIGIGFYNGDKKLRIYGLVVALLVCFKITLFDFSGSDMLQKMILFLVAGVVALIISGIYVLLDRKYNK